MEWHIKAQVHCDKKVSEATAKFQFQYDEYTTRNEGYLDDSCGCHHYVDLYMDKKENTHREIGLCQGWIRRHYSHVLKLSSSAWMYRIMISCSLELITHTHRQQANNTTIQVSIPVVSPFSITSRLT